MSTKPQSKDYLYGVPELLILKILSEDEMYGYEIVQNIISRSENEFRFGEGVIYPLLHSMQKRRLLAIRREKVNGRTRIYYRLTATGKKKLAEQTSQWIRVSNAIQKFLSGEAGESPDAAGA